MKRTVEDLMNTISVYEKEFKKWDSRVDKIIKRYRDESPAERGSNSTSKFNILWSNVNTLTPACFAKLPLPDVSRRYRDNDPVGRVASLILERALEYEIQHYPDYRSALTNCVQDRFLGGRGTAWVRYEPHFKNQEMPEGLQITEDIDEPDEMLDYECAPVDYVNWKDFGHDKARTWEEVSLVWRIVYLTPPAVEERFGEKIAKKLPYDASPSEKDELNANQKQARIYEMWCKTSQKVYWVSKSYKDFLDVKDDPLELEGFWPCPKPVYATLTTETLVPVPDFVLYQNQARELDILCDRIDGLIKALQVRGAYNSAIPELGRLFTEGQNTALIPVKDWTAFSEKNGLKGSIDIVELRPIYEALTAAYQAVQQIKAQIYEITGISDIVRGQTVASETATAQNIKGQYATLRLKSMQNGVAEFATALLQIKAQIICKQFDPQTIIAISAAEQLSDVDKQMVPAALELLKNKTLRDFRVEVSSDSMVLADEQQEKEDRISFLGTLGNFMEKSIPAVKETPQLAPLIADLLKFSVTAFKVGRTIEGRFDQVIDQLTEQAKQPAPDPKALEQQAKQQEVAQRLQAETQKTQMQIQSDERIAAMQAQVDAANDRTATMIAQMQEQGEKERQARDLQFQEWLARFEAANEPKDGGRQE